MIKPTIETKLVKDDLTKVLVEISLARSTNVVIGVLSSAGKYNKRRIINNRDKGENRKLGKKRSKKAANIADIATFNEFGTRTIPSRPFMAQTFEKRRSKVEKIIKDYYTQIVDGKIKTKKALDSIGVIYKGFIQHEIPHGNFVANKKSTIKRKGSSRPLISTGTLRQSIQYELRSL